MRGRRQLRDNQDAAQPLPVLPLPEVHQPGHGPSRRPRGSHARRKELRRRLQPLQSNAATEITKNQTQTQFSSPLHQSRPTDSSKRY